MQIAKWLKSRRTSSLLLAAGISLSLFITIFVIISAIQNHPYSTKAVDTTSAVPVATVSSVDIVQAGDGSSVTIADETLAETGDNATRRTVLNNNKVVYRVNYNVQAAAMFKIKFKMPANNVIDPSCISSGSVCNTDESSLSSAVSDNLHTGSDETSYTKNVATCVIEPDSTGSGSWTVTAYPWGGDGEKISPEVYIDDVAQTAANTASANDPVTIMAKANYFLKPGLNGGGNLSNRLITGLFFGAQIYGQTSNKQDNRSLGLEPLASSFTVDIDTSGLPSG